MLYDYKCSDCDHQMVDVQQSINDKPLVKCEKCGRNTLERVLFAPTVFVKQEATTIGQLSERNAKKLGKREVQERTLRDKDSKKTAMQEARKEMHSKINGMNDSQRRRFVENG